MDAKTWERIELGVNPNPKIGTLRAMVLALRSLGATEITSDELLGLQNTPKKSPK